MTPDISHWGVAKPPFGPVTIVSTVDDEPVAVFHGPNAHENAKYLLKCAQEAQAKEGLLVSR